MLAETFEPTTAAFVADAGVDRPRLAIDLGCGPGSTSELVLRLTAPERLVAVDSSPAFVAECARRLGARAEARHADAENLPEDLAGAALIFSRMLLGHLRDRLRAAEDWRRRLAPGGALLIEEVESIETGDPTLSRYLEVQRGVLRARGAALEAGPELAEWACSAGGRSRMRSLTVAPARAARLFEMNLRAWRADAVAERIASAAEVAHIAAALERIAAGGGDAGEVGWRMRQAHVSTAQA